MPLSVDPKFISQDMTTDNELAVETQARIDADAALQDQIDALAGGGDPQAIIDIQNEIDAIELGAGLESDGTYMPDASSNYLDQATSLKNADMLLDSQIKTVAEDLISESDERQAQDEKFIELFEDTKEPTGFIDRTSSTISFSDQTRTLTVAPVSGDFSIYIQGQKLTVSSTLTKQIPDTSGSYFFFINENSELDYITTFNVSLFTISAYVAYVLWDENDDKAITFAEERHGITMDGSTHSYLHTTRGTQLVSGGSIGFTTTGDGTSNADAQVSISDTRVSDEDIVIQISNSASPSQPHQQILSPIAEIPVYYRQGTTWRKSTATQYPVSQGTTRARFNKNTAGTWSLEEASANNKFLVSYIFATTNISEPIIALLGQDEYSSLSDAETRAAWSTISFGDLPAQEIKLLHIVIYETSSTFTNVPKCAIREVKDLRFGADREVSATSFNTDHSNLSGLGNDDHLQYLPVTGIRPMSGDLNMANNDINNVDVITSNKSEKNINVDTPTYTTVSNNGTLTLIASSSSVHFLTGTATGYSVVFPNATTLSRGTNYEIYNRSSSPITLKYSDGSTIGVLSTESVSSLILQDNATAKGLFSPFTVEVAQAAGIQNYSVTATAAVTITSATDTQVVGSPSFTITPMSGTYIIFLSTSNSTTSNNALNYMSLYKDGTQITGSERVAQGVSTGFVFQLSTQAVASFNGTEQLRVYARVSTGTLTINARSIAMLRLGPA